MARLSGLAAVLGGLELRVWGLGFLIFDLGEGGVQGFRNTLIETLNPSLFKDFKAMGCGGSFVVRM